MTEEAFIPKGEPISLEQLANYTDNGEVAITRGDVEKAIATSDEAIKPYLKAAQNKPKQ